VIEEVGAECPFCGEPVSLSVDTTAGREQRYYEDCAVCCRPMAVAVSCRPGEVVSLTVSVE
jgi:Cysteine-rich CPXCG